MEEPLEYLTYIGWPVVGAILAIALAAGYHWGWLRLRRFRLTLAGLLALPTLILLLLIPDMLGRHGGGGAGFSGAYAGAGPGIALALAVQASPFVAALGFSMGWVIDYLRKPDTPDLERAAFLPDGTKKDRTLGTDCRQCGAQLAPQDRFCPQCGTRTVA